MTTSLPKPGDILHLDYRNDETLGLHAGTQQGRKARSSHERLQHRPIKLLQWNIERGYQLDLIIQQLTEVDADVLSLQEVDVGCERSGCRDTGAAIAQALGLNYLFICEFEELKSDLRDTRSQGGGVHGNAILTKFDFVHWEAVEHSHHPINWNADPSDQAHPLAAKEPRRGRRLTLTADICTPQGPLRVYCCHLEVFCGILSRVWQFSDILQHAKEHQRTQLQIHQSEGAPQGSVQERHTEHVTATQTCCQAILGDLNTMAHGVARLSPNYCCDVLRWKTIGLSEAEWWQKYVLSVTGLSGINKYLLQYGLPQQVAQAAMNPGFYDPFDVRKDITLDNHAYRIGMFHLMAGKLDWALLRGVIVVNKTIGNCSYAASDHRWLLVEVMLSM